MVDSAKELVDSNIIKMVQVDLKEASGNLPQLIARAVSGEDIIIVQGSKPIIRLVPIDEVEQQVLSEAEETDNTLMEEMLSAFEEG